RHVRSTAASVWLSGASSSPCRRRARHQWRCPFFWPDRNLNWTSRVASIAAFLKGLNVLVLPRGSDLLRNFDKGGLHAIRHWHDRRGCAGFLDDHSHGYGSAEQIEPTSHNRSRQQSRSRAGQTISHQGGSV